MTVKKVTLESAPRCPFTRIAEHVFPYVQPRDVKRDALVIATAFAMTHSQYHDVDPTLQVYCALRVTAVLDGHRSDHYCGYAGGLFFDDFGGMEPDECDFEQLQTFASAYLDLHRASIAVAA